jgi:hypothetical protein
MLVGILSGPNANQQFRCRIGDPPGRVAPAEKRLTEYKDSQLPRSTGGLKNARIAIGSSAAALASQRRGLVPRSLRYEFDAERRFSERPLSRPFRIVSIGLSADLAEYFVGNLGDMTTLEACPFELVLGRLAAAVEASDGGRTVGSTTGDLTQLSQPTEAVG